MNYQWFDTWVECDEDMLKALKECSYGIIDQLISLYVMMHIDYFEKKGKKPKVNGDYVRMISRKYFPYIKQLNNLLKDPLSDNRLKKASEETREHLKRLLTKAEEESKKTEIKQIELSDSILDIMKIKESIIRDIENVGFDRIEIEKTFDRLASKGLKDMSVKEIKQAVILELTKLKGKVNRKKKLSQEEMFKAITQ